MILRRRRNYISLGALSPLSFSFLLANQIDRAKFRLARDLSFIQRELKKKKGRAGAPREISLKSRPLDLTRVKLFSLTPSAILERLPRDRKSFLGVARVFSCDGIPQNLA